MATLLHRHPSRITRNPGKPTHKLRRKAGGRAILTDWRDIATRPVLEALEQRVLLSVTASPTNIYAVETESFDPGDLDGTGSLYVAQGNSLSADSVREQSLTVDGSMTIDPGSGYDDPSHASFVDDLVMDQNGSGQFLGTLNLTDNALIIETTASNRQNVLDMVQSALYSGYNGGNWNGTGIISSTAAADPSKYAIGYIVNDSNYDYSTGEDNSDGPSLIYTTYAGQAVDSNSIILAYTLTGDTNLNGVVNSVDFGNFDYGSNGMWLQGSFTYNGIVNSVDFGDLAANWGSSIPFSGAPNTSLPASPQYVATFTSADNGPASGYTATINWGDGSSTTDGSILAEGNGTYAVVGTHSYPLDTNGTVTTGNYTVSVQVTETSTEDTSTANSTANVTYLPDLMISGPSSATTGDNYSLDLSAMFATNFDGAMNDITSWTVNWGDGDTQTYYQDSTFNPGWAVVNHTYSSSTDQIYDITATAFDGTHTYTAPETIDVALNFAGGTPAAIQATQGVNFDGAVATFQGDSSGDASDYSAAITWGDGSSPAVGTITYAGNDTYDVTGSYTYEEEGSFGVDVQITDATDSAQLWVNGTADVAVAPTTASAISLPGTLPTFNPATPTDTLTMPSGMNTFTLNSSEISGSPASGTPLIAAADPTAEPDQTVSVTGSDFTIYDGNDAFDDTQFVVYGQTSSSNGTFSDAEIQDEESYGAMLTINTSQVPDSMYLVWAVNGNGAGAPIAVNDTDAWWVGAPNEPVTQTQSLQNVQAYLGQTLAVYGQNLTNLAASPQSWVYLQPASGTSGPGAWANVTSENPYQVQFTLPSTLSVNGTYQVWVNNGLGGQYSWSEAPTTVTVAAASAPTWGGTTINVLDYGADNTGNPINNNVADIRDALNALEPGDTLYFPAGTYVVDYTSSDHVLQVPNSATDILIEGGGAASTSIVFQGYLPDTDFGASDFEIGGTINGPQTAAQVEIDDLTFEYNGNGLTSNGTVVKNSSGYLLEFHDVYDLSLNNDTLIGGPALSIQDLAQGNMTVNDSTIIGGRIGGESNLFLNEDNFYMGYGTESAMSAGSESAITNCTIQDYDDSADNPSGSADGRMLELAGSSYIYVANDNTDNLVAPAGGNVGEQINAEGNQTLFDGGITSASSDQVNFSYTGNEALQISPGMYVVVTAGTGLGEIATVTDVQYTSSGDTYDYTLTLQGSWNVAPDSTSTIDVGSDAYDCAFYSNDLSFAPGEYGNCGIELYTGSYNADIDDNVIQGGAEGVSLWSYGTAADDFFDQISDNQIINALSGVALLPVNAGSPNGAADDIGVVVQGNVLQGGVDGVSLATASGETTHPAALAAIEHNLIAPAPQSGPVYNRENNGFAPQGGVVIQGNSPDALLYDNTLYEPQAEGDDTILPAAIYYDSSPTSGILLRNNDYIGFASNNTYYYASNTTSPSFFGAPANVYSKTVSSGDSAGINILLWDDGASSLSWSATIQSGADWLTVTSGDSNSGTITGEDDSSSDSILSLTADSSGLSPGTYSATVTVIAGGQTRVMTVTMIVTS